MHELAITESIVEAVTERIPDAKVTCVRLVIGKLSGVTVDSVRFCFDVVVDGTNLQGADLVVSEPGGRFQCRRCRGEFDSDDLISLCTCGSADLEVLAGEELMITSVEVRGHV